MRRTGVSEYTLSTGRKMRSPGGVLGLRVDEDGTQCLTSGFDALVPEDYDEQCARLTPGERREIAYFMCMSWAKWGGLNVSEESKEPGAEG